MMNNFSSFNSNAVSDDELENITGGKNINKFGNNPVTKMKCKFCGYEVVFAGKFEDKTFECKKCHKKNALEPIK